MDPNGGRGARGGTGPVEDQLGSLLVLDCPDVGAPQRAFTHPPAFPRTGRRGERTGDAMERESLRLRVPFSVCYDAVRRHTYVVQRKCYGTTTARRLKMDGSDRFETGQRGSCEDGAEVTG